MRRHDALKRTGVGSILVVLLALGLAFYWALPKPLFATPSSTALYARDGSLLGARIAADGQWRLPAGSVVPTKLAAALVAAEDKRFYQHPGIDPLALARAISLNLKHHKTVSGASTLTMQVIRLARGNPPRTLREKALEAVLALRLELAYSKAEILSLYAGHAPYGGNVVGAEAAAWRYFGRAPETLSWAEAATLAVLPNSPALIHPGRSRVQLQAKRNALLHRLAALGTLTAQQLELAQLEPLPGPPRPLPLLAPHLLDTLAAQPHAAARLNTTLDPSLQIEVSRLLAARAAANTRQGVRNAAALVIDNHSLQVLAYVGNSPASAVVEDGTSVDIIRAERSTGSVLKPFLYAAAMQEGRIQPSSLIPDVPVRYEGFRPENFDRQYRGAVRAGDALALSLNVPAVHLLRSYGQTRFYDVLQRLGMSTLHRTPDGYGLSLILGGAEGSLWDVASLYAQLANITTSGAGTRQARYAGVQVLRDTPAAPTRAADFGAGAAWLTLEALREVGRPDDEGHWKSFASALPLAWKTGTSYGLRDGWAVGVTPRHTIAVWVGNASGEGRAGLTGAAMAAPLLFDIVQRLGTRSWFATPWQDLREITVCKDDGYLPSQGCETETRQIPLNAHFETASPYHQSVHLDPTQRWRVDSRCQPVSEMVQKTFFVLPPAMEAFRRRQDVSYQTLPRWRDDCAEAGSAKQAFDLLVPAAGVDIFIPTELGGRRSRLVLQAVHRDPYTPLHWHLDGDYLGSTQAPHQLALDIPPGTHELVLVDGDGARLVRRFTVLSKDQPAP